MTTALILDSKRRTHEFQNEKENPRLIIISRHTLLEKKKVKTHVKSEIHK